MYRVVVVIYYLFRNVQAHKVTEEVNSWVKKYTDGLIPRILSTRLPSSTWIVLANALYFKGDWSKPFNK